MSSKENIITLLKELEQEILALEEEIIKKTDSEVNDTIAEFTYIIKNKARSIDMDMTDIQTKMDSFNVDYKQDPQIPALKLAHLT